MDSRVAELKNATEVARIHTPPQLEVGLAAGERGDRYAVDVIARNFIAFKARWLIVTMADVVLSGVMLQGVQFHPASERQNWRYCVDIHSGQERNAFVELRFEWESLDSSSMSSFRYDRADCPVAIQGMPGVWLGLIAYIAWAAIHGFSSLRLETG